MPSKKKSNGNKFLNWLRGTDKIKEGEKIRFDQNNTSIMRKIKNSGVKLNNKKILDNQKCGDYLNRDVYPYLSSHKKLINELEEQIIRLTSKKNQKKWLGGRIFKFSESDKKELENLDNILKEIKSKKYDIYHKKALKLCADLGFEVFMTELDFILKDIHQKYIDSPMSNVDEERQLMFHETICRMRRIEKGLKNNNKINSDCLNEKNNIQEIKLLFDELEEHGGVKKLTKKNKNKNKNKNHNKSNRKTNKKNNNLTESNTPSILQTPSERYNNNKIRKPKRRIFDNNNNVEKEEFKSLIDSTLEEFKSIDKSESESFKSAQQ